VLEIRLDEGDGYTICRPVGELDAYTVGQFREALGELASKPKLLIDMSEVPFVDSASARLSAAFAAPERAAATSRSAATVRRSCGSCTRRVSTAS
jgi:anti-anti-sigma factor